ncbi:hypothetical protein K443DRAFT_678219 [Laccaria amethystina LaAM-08-1]|uniref:Uncharacterized protein n=1 Tax=Laccaria amethystina LaAM-08-1 TaxID=1095629 RepID=A0A0C9Y0T3_9AGAR|nr:hypothetical protein K443DRAFT_678219 [Laccaria amethystina LaAM-08-1]
MTLRTQFHFKKTSVQRDHSSISRHSAPLGAVDPRTTQANLRASFSLHCLPYASYRELQTC